MRPSKTPELQEGVSIFQLLKDPYILVAAGEWHLTKLCAIDDIHAVFILITSMVNVFLLLTNSNTDYFILSKNMPLLFLQMRQPHSTIVITSS